MTPEEEHEFCRVAAMGIACGLQHRYEWFTNFTMHVLPVVPDTEMHNAYAKVCAAFVAFERTTAGDPWEQVELDKLDTEKLLTKIEAWYKSRRDKK